MKDLTIGVAAALCRDCSKLNIGTQLFNMFSWKADTARVIGFDKEAEEILISEEQLMRIIQLVNPIQRPRRIRLLPISGPAAPTAPAIGQEKHGADHYKIVLTELLNTLRAKANSDMEDAKDLCLTADTMLNVVATLRDFD